MALVCRAFLVVALLIFAGPRLFAASAETRAFDAAARELHGGLYQQAEADFADFVQKYPGSARVHEAIFAQAETRLELTNYAGAIQLLASHQSQAGKWADTNCYWLAEAYFQNGDYRLAADTFGRLGNEYPASYWRLEAAIREAASRAHLTEWTNVVRLLEQTNGVFQSAAGTQPISEPVVRGFLLLSEAHLALEQCVAAEAALQPLAGAALSPRLNWQRQYLLGRILVASGRVEEALESTTTLMSLAAVAGQRSFQADSAAFQAALFESLGRTDEAIAAYQKNLVEGMPLARQKEASLKIAELFMAQGKINEAAQRVQEALGRYPKEAVAELGWLTLGELSLRQHLAGTNASFPLAPGTNASPVTNFLQQALFALQTFTNQFPQSAWLGRGELYLGWCFWYRTNIAASQAAFQVAIDRLPGSAEQASAYFKLADTQLLQTNFDGAISNYTAVIEKFDWLAEVRTNLFEPALYQIMRASLAKGDLANATKALGQILSSYPNGFYTDQALLLTGQQVARRNPAQARQLFSEFAARVPQAAALPEVELAIARTYGQADQWPAAIEHYDRWLVTFTNASARPRAEFDCAWANFLAGRHTNALALFTNFVARFPTHELAPYAQWWVGDYYFNSGKPWEAEQSYQWIFQNTNWAGWPVAYQAKMMAGRSAFARQGWKDATNYFTMLTSDPKCPRDLWVEAMFGYGDTLMTYDVPETNRPALLQTAAAIFARICDASPTNQQAALAWGEMAQCLLQYAKDPQDFEAVSNAFQRAISTPGADVKARSIAKVGLGFTLEKMAAQAGADKTKLLEEARRQYNDVFYDRQFLREGERPDLFWVRKAGLEAARVSAALNEPEPARRAYQRLQVMFFSTEVEDKINAIKIPEQTAAP